MDNYDVIPLFSTPVYSSKENYNITDDEYSYITSREIDTDFLGQVDSADAFLSQEKYILNHPKMVNIRKICEKHLQNYQENVLCIKQNLYITNSWISIKKPGQDHHVHKHPNSVISGVYYVNVVDDYLNLSGDPGFLKDYNFSYGYTDWNIFNSSNWGVPVTSGSIVIFPSCTFHGVSKNESDENRIIIGFNTFVSGSMGEYAYCSDLNLGGQKYN